MDIGIQADVGVLQRMPKQMGNDSLMRELAYSARRFYADEALKIGELKIYFTIKAQFIFSMARA